MKNIKQIELCKSRSYTACITEAFNTITHNLKTILMNTWIYALLTSLTFAAYTSTAFSIMTSGITMLNGAFLFAALLLYLCATIVFFAHSSMLINMRPMALNIKRTVRIMLTLFVFSFIVGVVFGIVSIIIFGHNQSAPDAGEDKTAVWILYAVFMIIALLTLPYIYVFAKYMMEPETKLRRLVFKSYKTGLHHWSFIFTTMLIVYLCMTVCAIITCLPVVIILSARMISLNGMALFSDPSGLPGYFDIMQFGLFTMAAFIWSYISVFYMFVCYFIYGSIEARVKEKKEYLNTQREQNA